MRCALLGLLALVLFPVAAYSQVGDEGGSSSGVHKLSEGFGRFKVPGDSKVDERVRRILDERQIKYSIDEDGDFRVVFTLEDNRTQLALIRSATSKIASFEIREVWSVGYKSAESEFPPEMAVKFLDHNATLKFGAWEKHNNTVMFVTKFAANADSQTLYDAMMITLETADVMEKELSGDADEF